MNGFDTFRASEEKRLRLSPLSVRSGPEAVRERWRELGDEDRKSWETKALRTVKAVERQRAVWETRQIEVTQAFVLYYADIRKSIVDDCEAPGPHERIAVARTRWNKLRAKTIQKYEKAAKKHPEYFVIPTGPNEVLYERLCSEGAFDWLDGSSTKDMEVMTADTEERKELMDADSDTESTDVTSPPIVTEVPPIVTEVPPIVTEVPPIVNEVPPRRRWKNRFPDLPPLTMVLRPRSGKPPQYSDTTRRPRRKQDVPVRTSLVNPEDIKEEAVHLQYSGKTRRKQDVPVRTSLVNPEDIKEEAVHLQYSDKTRRKPDVPERTSLVNPEDIKEEAVHLHEADLDDTTHEEDTSDDSNIQDHESRSDQDPRSSDLNAHSHLVTYHLIDNLVVDIQLTSTAKMDSHKD